MDRYPASVYTATKAPYSDSLSLRLRSRFNLAHTVTRWLVMQKHAVTAQGLLRPLVSTRFQVLFTPSRGAFHLSLTVLVHYRSPVSI